MEEKELTRYEVLEKALSRLRLRFGWRGDVVTIWGIARGEVDEDVPVQMRLGEKVIEITTPLHTDLSGEQVSVIVWQEARRSSEPTFCLLPENPGDPLRLCCRIPRPEKENPRALAAYLKEAISSLGRSRDQITRLLDDVSAWERRPAQKS